MLLRHRVRRARRLRLPRQGLLTRPEALATTGCVQFIAGGRLARLLQAGEDWLTHRILAYAKRQQFTRYTSTLAEAWRLSIRGLTASLLTAIECYRSVPELGPEQADGSNAVAAFALLEAQRHRARGVSLFMFLGLYKYYRQSYLDWIEQAPLSLAERRLGVAFVGRVFDRIEIALCCEWTSKPEAELLRELQNTNRTVTNEKNAYLTVFESVLAPVLLLDAEGRIETLNHAAAKLVRARAAPGAAYYGEEGSGSQTDTWHPRGQPVAALFPWLPDTHALLADPTSGSVVECTVADERGPRVFEARASRLVDVSEKMIGTVIVLNDITEHKALAERLDGLARTDSLTGVNNRRHFLELAELEYVRARRYSRALSVLVVDIDHFKLVNDTYGHAVGDELLTALARAMSGTLRAVDTLGRIGGEEFAMVLPETAGDQAVLAAERIRLSVGRAVVPTAVGPVCATVSVGVATLEGSDHSLDDLLGRADGALYRAKALGRNVVATASPGRPPLPSPWRSSFASESAAGPDSSANVAHGRLRSA
ncbi:MAG: diguanylate cyclase [Polyangiaceae bacterium]|nr:diguanylate cyclase [Polyangiaceae bacterium]